jgi:hypothetical protein
MQTGDEFNSLPPYIKRHLSTRDRQSNGLKYLARTIKDIRYAGKSLPELIQTLAELPTDGTGAEVVSELIRRLDELNETTKTQLAEALKRIAVEVQDQSSKRTVADRSVMRLLYRMNFQQAFSTAAACAASLRAIRREASYRFYLANGVDEAAREVLASTIWDSSIRYRRLIATDRALVLKIGLPRVLGLAPSTYWRMLAVGKTLDPSDYADVVAACADYPLELIWAIYENRLVGLLPQVLQMLEQYKEDAYLLNRILQCIARLGDAEGVTRAARYATDLLAREVPGPANDDQRFPSI